MKKFLCSLILILSISSITFAAKNDSANKDSSKAEEPAKEKKEIKPLWFNLSFNEGVSFAQITRIETMETRSNFVREHFLIGAFVNCKTDNLWFLDLELQLSAYYPFKTTFNGMQQFPKNPINYAFDLFFGAVYSFDDFKYILIDTSLGLHYMYQLTDEYHMNYVGLGFQGTLEFPISKRWTIVNNYFISYDNANLGSNKKVQLFDASYQYHIELGIRYSKRVQNQYTYIK